MPCETVALWFWSVFSSRWSRCWASGGSPWRTSLERLINPPATQLLTGHRAHRMPDIGGAPQRSRRRPTGVTRRVQPTSGPVLLGMIRSKDRVRDRQIRGVPRTRNPRTSCWCRGSQAPGSPARRIPPAIILNRSNPAGVSRRVRYTSGPPRGRRHTSPTVARLQAGRRVLDLRASVANRRARRVEKAAIPRDRGSQGRLSTRDHLPSTTPRPDRRPANQPLRRRILPTKAHLPTGRTGERPMGRPGDLLTTGRPPERSPRPVRTPDTEQNRPTGQPGLRMEPPPALILWPPVATGPPGSQNPPPIIRPDVRTCSPPGLSTLRHQARSRHRWERGRN
jgi:hypothetical protein